MTAGPFIVVRGCPQDIIMEVSKDPVPDSRLPLAENSSAVDRLQGTDGIRRPVAFSTDTIVKGLTPLRAFSERGVITEQFLEQYAYAYCSGLPEKSEVVIGWDPRDPEGIFPAAVVSGVRKAGCTAVVLGTFPTPGIALYHIWRGITASLAVTASHNSREYNGLKIFQGASALKMLPGEDRALTKRVLGLDYTRDIEMAELRGGRIDAREEALDVLVKFHLDPRNSWLPEGQTLGDFPLIVDAANGAFSGIVAPLLRSIHLGEVFEVNSDVGSGQVNFNGGVADLEGVSEINRGNVQFKEHRGVQEVFLRHGRGIVFDADGDRFYRLEYEPESDRVLVCSGDQNALLQARYLTAQRGPGMLFVTTVESDPNASRAAEALGFTSVITGVGDKWILRHAWNNLERFGIGSEESGHTITAGVLTTSTGREVPVFIGNGLKSAINTLVASQEMRTADTHWPFSPGLKRNFSIYYVRKERFYHNSVIYERVASVIEGACDWGVVERMVFDEEPEMLYLAVRDTAGRQLAAIFVRNSGTEEKIGVYVRGRQEDAAVLTSIGTAATAYLTTAMKDGDHPMVKAEKKVLKALQGGPLSLSECPVSKDVDMDRLFIEMADREMVIQATPHGFELTNLRSKILEAWR